MYNFLLSLSLTPKDLDFHSLNCIIIIINFFFSKLWRVHQRHIEKKEAYRPMLIGSSAIPSSSVAALLPFFFFEYHMKASPAYRLDRNTDQAR